MRRLALLFSMLSLSALGAGESLEAQLQQLNLPGNEAPAVVPRERMYAVQSRFAPLAHRHELTLGGAKNFTADGFLVTQEIDASYRFYLSDRWFLGLGGSYVFNDLSDGGKALVETRRMISDLAYARYRGELLVGFQPFYGKFRLTMDQVFYFDQYVAVGPGLVALDRVTAPALVGDIGIAFWLGRWGSLRVGLKDYFFNEQRRLSKAWVNSLVGHLDFGVLFGG